MTDLKPYLVSINGLDHTLRLNERDAKRYGDRARPMAGRRQAKPKKKAKIPANKQVKAATKQSEPVGNEETSAEKTEK